MSISEHAAAASHPTRSAVGEAQVRRTVAAVHADYQGLVRELTELPQDEFDREAGWTRPVVKVAVRVVR